MISRDAFVAEARSWLGVRWLHQGRNRHGVDCIGLLLVTCWALDITDYDTTGYGHAPDADFLRGECERMMTPTTDPQPGDVYLMRYAGPPQHVAIATERGILHAYAPAGRVIETMLSDVWRRRIVAAYAVPGVG